jgi:hypothetical protein
MTDWQERITHGTNPATRAEHAVRYALAAPLVRDSDLWVDLGCGSGFGAREGLGDGTLPRALLVDIDEKAAKEAARQLGGVALQADLSDPAGIDAVKEAIGKQAKGTITCFEAIEHLANFVPLVETLAELSKRFTVILSVPNDAFWSLHNPYHHTMWGEGSFEELRALLPDGHITISQVALQGSAAVTEDTQLTATASITADGVPSHYLAAFGPRAGELQANAAVVQTDLEERRRWERQRESDLAYLAELNEAFERVVAEREDFRRYIHELEDRLGLPRSGAALPSGGG